MLVYTTGNAISPYYCNTIYENNYFAKIESGSPSKVSVFSKDYYCVNENYSEDKYLYFKPVIDGQLYFEIKNIERNDNELILQFLFSSIFKFVLDAFIEGAVRDKILTFGNFFCKLNILHSGVVLSQ